MKIARRPLEARVRVNVKAANWEDEKDGETCRIKELEIVEKATAEEVGLSWKDKDKKMNEVAIWTWKVDWRLWERTAGNKVKT